MTNGIKGFQEPPYDVRRVWIPVYGVNRKLVYLKWFCPECGAKRGSIGAWVGGYKIIRDIAPGVDVVVEQWRNPCGHVENDHDLYGESLTNGLNDDQESQENKDHQDMISYMRTGF